MLVLEIILMRSTVNVVGGFKLLKNYVGVMVKLLNLVLKKLKRVKGVKFYEALLKIFGFSVFF